MCKMWHQCSVAKSIFWNKWKTLSDSYLCATLLVVNIIDRIENDSTNSHSHTEMPEREAFSLVWLCHKIDTKLIFRVDRLH